MTTDFKIQKKIQAEMAKALKDQQRKDKKTFKENLAAVRELEKAKRQADKINQAAKILNKKVRIKTNKIKDLPVLLQELVLTQIQPEQNKVLEKKDNQLLVIPQKVFRLSSKKLFITYARCPVNPTEIFRQLQIKFFDKAIESWLIVQEVHNLRIVGKVETHIHGFIKLGKKCNIKDSDYLDISDDLGNTYHGKYESCKSEKNIIEYILKDFVLGKTLYTASEKLNNIIGQHGELKDISALMIEMARQGEIQQALDLLEKHDPATFLKNHMQYKKSFNSLYSESRKESVGYTLDDFDLKEEILDAFDFCIKNHTCLVVVGPSGVGKSCFVNVLLKDFYNLNPLTISNIDSLRYFDPIKFKAIIFDDCNFSSADRFLFLALLNCELGSTVHCRYNNVQIPPTTPRIFIQNDSMVSILKNARLDIDKSITRRFREIVVGNLIPSKLKDVALPEILYL